LFEAISNGSLHFGRHPVLTLVADEKDPHLFRIRYPDGWISTPANSEAPTWKARHASAEGAGD
jgi:hypothetical protein